MPTAAAVVCDKSHPQPKLVSGWREVSEDSMMTWKHKSWLLQMIRYTMTSWGYLFPWHAGVVEMYLYTSGSKRRNDFVFNSLVPSEVPFPHLQWWSGHHMRWTWRWSIYWIAETGGKWSEAEPTLICAPKHSPTFGTQQISTGDISNFETVS